jgi:2,4-dienoyl-CoA reductase-like NADH-dependent reductase (Old Yellow Enzyme family)
VVSPSHDREAAHRAFPKKLEDWDIERIIRDYADAAERMQAAGMDGIELEAYGHLMDQFWSPLTNTLDAPYGGSLDNRLRFTIRSAARRYAAGRAGVHRRRALHRRRMPARRPDAQRTAWRSRAA